MKVPKKNISNNISDIKSKRGSGGYVRVSTETPPINTREIEEFFEDSSRVDGGEARDMPVSKFSVKKLILIFAIVGIIGIGFIFYKINLARTNFEQSAYGSISAVRSVLGDAGIASGDYSGIGNFDIANPARFLDLFKNLVLSYKDIQTLSVEFFDLAHNLETIKKNLIDYVINKKGDDLLAVLAKTKGNLEGLSAKISSANPSALKNFLPIKQEEYLVLSLNLEKAKAFSESLIFWLKSEEPRHIVIFFQNSSEMRPSGGFLGSYAEIKIENAAISEIDVRDINEPDRELKRNIVPPKPLQGQVKRWRAADANWFFDFSKSAEKLIDFLESSDLYKSREITLDGAIAISPKVMSDILSVTGPIVIDNPKTTLDKDNFLSEIQKDVQDKQQSGSTYPKEILKKAMPLIMAELRSLESSDRDKLLELAKGWLEYKDLMVYFKNNSFQNFLDAYGITGKVMNLSGDFNGNYLAVVNSNIGGGKSDQYVQQSVKLESKIGGDGFVSNTLTILRKHNGSKSSYWWYRVTNVDYLRIFTPSDSQLTSMSGGVKKSIQPSVNYVRDGYEVDKDLTFIESTYKEFSNHPLVSGFVESGKRVFALWVETKLGATSKVVLNYTNHLFYPPADGINYRMVFEKQSGTNGDYDFEIYAPVGYHWLENNSPVFEYKSQNPPARLVLELTLSKTND
jgi:hypothetical protein